ncbi:hypothetical protein BJH44_004282 [Salmonella enterica subsp. enterica serovar Bredeney]|uniref:hypothetical protein n=1 Tax=Salmonella enterica TaxID=28901 RepID=UPI0009AE0FAC|nr:hypothetical protein [Salmonella enterica]EDV7203296.1 hypothetical protein [Salmonella enterica subsp. enterica serovar Bredeney]
MKNIKLITLHALVLTHSIQLYASGDTNDSQIISVRYQLRPEHSEEHQPETIVPGHINIKPDANVTRLMVDVWYEQLVSFKNNADGKLVDISSYCGLVDKSQRVSYIPLFMWGDVKDYGRWLSSSVHYEEFFTGDYNKNIQYRVYRLNSGYESNGSFMFTVYPGTVNMKCDIPKSIMSINGWDGGGDFSILSSDPFPFRMKIFNNARQEFFSKQYRYRTGVYTTFKTASNTGLKDFPSALSCSSMVGIKTSCGSLNFTTVGGRTEIDISRRKSDGVIKIGGSTITPIPTVVSATQTTGVGLTRESTYNLPITVHMNNTGVFDDIIYLKMKYD